MKPKNSAAKAYLKAARETEPTTRARGGGGQGQQRTLAGTRPKYRHIPNIAIPT